VRSFATPVWYQIDNGKWAQGTTITVDGEGVHTISVGKSSNDSKPQTESLGIDLTPPVVTLEIDPLPEQEAGIFTATGDATYTFKAADGLSGVSSIEIATDGKTYTPYTKPFTLPAGRHVLRCRATDRAGNQSKAITGEWISGGAETSLELTVPSLVK